MTELPSKIGKYKITGVAGKGAMGIVYIGHDPFVDRTVAVKVRTERSGSQDPKSPAAQRLFFNEAQTAGALDHPNILKVYDAGEADDQLFITTEYVEQAQTLRDFCVPGQLLPIETVVRLVRQCADALDFAHQHGVTHRDIKPANIMLTQAGDVKIVDFGIAQRTVTDQTQVAGWFGSPLYMSPEQARDEALTSQTDLFSLGVVMYELLTGERPFDAKGIPGLIDNVLHKHPKPIEVLRPEAQRGLSAVVSKTLEKTLAKRYQSGAELASDLGKVLDDLARPQLTDDQKQQAVRHLKFFQDFSDSEVSELIKVSTWERYPARGSIINEAEAGHSFYIVVSGDVSVSRAGKEIQTLSEGHCFGEMAYLTDGKRSASIISNGEAMVMQISSPIRAWASLSVQLRLSKIFHETLIERLSATSKALARHLP